MATSNFTVRIEPDIIDGDVSKVIGAQTPSATDAPFQSGDILFDWQPIQVPKGTSKLVSISGYIMGQDGGVQVNSDIEFVFAKPVSGVAPTTLGEENEPQTLCFELPKHLIGFAKVDRSGKNPPNLILLSLRYFISGDFSSGLKYSIFLTCSSVKGTSNRSL